jgi:macrolide transport system ATP-binding/permease protein
MSGMTDWKQVVRARLAELQLTPAAESELAEELAQHLDDLHRELKSGGASDEDAYRTAVSELDDLCTLRADLDRSDYMPKHETPSLGDATTSSYLQDLQRDLRYTARTMRRNPLFVLFVVLTLGLGIGANTTVFTVINTLILNPMPVSAPSELVAVGSVASAGPTGSAGSAGAPAQGNALMPLSYPNFDDYRHQNSVFRSVAGYTRMRAITWQTQGGTQPLLSELVTGDYFSTLGVETATGRTFGTEVDGSGSGSGRGSGGAEAVAVMNYGTWQTRFGGAPDIVGKQLRLNDVVVTVIGVTRPGFIGVNGLVGPDLWLPFALGEQLLPTEMRAAVANRSMPLLQGVARVKPGVTVAQAHANITALGSTLAREYPAANEGHTAAARPIGDVLFGGGSTMMRFAAAVLAMVAGVVLLIACSNVANLLLARSAARQHEMAVRVALGASRARLVRQLLTESLCLGLISGTIGLLIAAGGMQLLAKTLPATGTFVASRLDGKVLLFAVIVSLATGFIFGIVPSLSASRVGVAGVLQDARNAGRSARRVSVANVLLVGQVALSFLLLVTAALFLRSIQRAYEIDPGFKADRLAVFITNPGQAGYDAARIDAFYRDVRERASRLPGVESVSWASNMPLFARPVSGLQIEGRAQSGATGNLAAATATATATIVNTIDLGYFETTGVAIDKGRAFTDVDRASSRPVVIVNEKLARDFWPGDDAIGKRVRVPGEEQLREVVGVARTANYTAWGEAAQRCVYVPLAQNPLPSMTLYVRVRNQQDPAQMINTVRSELNAAGPQVMISGVRTGAQVIDGSLFQARIGVALLSVFGLLALGLASIGLYGILVYAVNQRQREIGVRMALGATQSGVRRLILKQGMSLVIGGLAIGFVAALLVGRLLSRMLYGVGASDPISVSVAALVLLAVAALACYLPARRATRVDPLVALRQV